MSVADRQHETTESIEDGLRELDARLANGEPQPFPTEADDIGGELIAILSKGLYTNPLDCLREYAQNSVDAGATEISIKITGNSISIIDDGHGMGILELHQAKRFGLSPKSIADHVGFRGIGIYSGFDICRRLVITSTKKGDVDVRIMSFEFASMRRQLDEERGRPAGAERTSLIDLLTNHTNIDKEVGGAPADEHYTHVELVDISPQHMGLMANVEQLQKYLLQNLPIDFSSKFEHRKAIAQNLKTGVPGHRAVRVRLALDNTDEIMVQKYEGEPAGKWQPPTFGTVHDSKGNPLAFYWACLKRRRKTTKNEPYAGFVYKVKGFTVGDRDALRPIIGRDQVYVWYTGEVYVLDGGVIPNAERNDFETSPAKTTLEIELAKHFGRPLAKKGELFSRSEKAREVILGQVKVLSEIEQDKLKPALAKYTELQRVIDALPKRRLKDVDDETKALAEDTLTRARNLAKSLEKEMKHPTHEVERRKAQSKADPETPTEGGSTELDDEELAAPKGLVEVFREAGWELDEAEVRLAQLFQAAIEDAFGPGSEEQARIMESIGERLADDDEL